MTRYDVLYLDPAWRYRNVKTGGSHTSGAAQKYPTLSLHELSQMPLRDIAAKNCIMALWATVPLGGDPYELMAHWGWTYKTELFWHKVGRKGTGYWLRGEVEKLLIGIRGHVPAWRENMSNWLEAEEPGGLTETPLSPFVEACINAIGDISKTEALNAIEQHARELYHPLSGLAEKPSKVHSRKPAAVRALLERMTPGQRRAELFATEMVPGWDPYGLDFGHDFTDQTFWAGLREAA